MALPLAHTSLCVAVVIVAFLLLAQITISALVAVIIVAAIAVVEFLP